MVHGYKGVKFQNWARTYGCCPEMYFQPTSVEEVKEVLALARQQNKRVKVVGGGHSPSDIACTDGFMIHMGKMNRILKVDTEKKQVTMEAGILLADLNHQLDKHGLALSNLGAVSDVTAGGVIGSGTHNTGIKHGILATQVVALTLLTADGTILECSESSNVEVFQAARVHLGCLGVILTVTLQCVPQFHLQETTFPSTLKELQLLFRPELHGSPPGPSSVSIITPMDQPSLPRLWPQTRTAQRVLDNLDSHLKKSEYFRFLWFPHSENVSVIYQDHTNKHLPARPCGLDQSLFLLAPVQWEEGKLQPQPQDLQLRMPLQAACPGLGHPQREDQSGPAGAEGHARGKPQGGGPLPRRGTLHSRGRHPAEPLLPARQLLHEHHHVQALWQGRTTAGLLAGL
ncbi:L-gulonolactone oxidase isoform X5 [Ovis aries]|uniref:L-gulonolactone oxidase isoform X5 n=1 Tax=Ovis aries TaxID=9940 RepID=UPI001C2E2C51|nr:L-gulonolactone oxidase isoform X5 [Ovis aries]XP_060265144.1 L-gulonolactone oxidase isoform X5 [Ovis aries]